MTFWMTTAAGQRLVFLRHGRVKLWDFNPYAVKRARRKAEQISSSADCDKVVDHATVLRPPSREPRFMQDIVSKLPFVERAFELPQEFQGIHLDDGHLIAFNVSIFACTHQEEVSTHIAPTDRVSQ